VWKRIRHIKVPRVTNMFSWKACNYLLPTKNKKKIILKGPTLSYLWVGGRDS